jgi:hypothetical protein
MTEAEWLATSEPVEMLVFLKERGSDRKLRLFAVACCRAISEYFPSAEYDETVRWAELFAEGMASQRQFTQKYRRFTSRFNGAVAEVLYALAVESAMWSAVEVARRTRIFPARARGPQALLLRDVIGNPEHPVSVNPAWLTSDVRLLAEGIYNERAFDRMPILADALQDAGCDSAEILDHCRGAGPHVRGCWVVDLVLGRG